MSTNLGSQNYEQVREVSRETNSQVEVQGGKASAWTIGVVLIGLKAARCTARLQGETARYAELDAQVKGYEAAIEQANKEFARVSA
jgi:hypothetical protein